MNFPEIWNYKLVGWYKKWYIEKWFERELMGRLRIDWYICFHPQDVGMASKFLDVHLITPSGQLHWIELKQIPWNTFNVKDFRDDQVILLREMDRRNPEIARVWVYSVKHNKYIVIRYTDMCHMKNERWGVKLFSNK